MRRELLLILFTPVVLAGRAQDAERVASGESTERRRADVLKAYLDLKGAR
jgi:hypothetical protein